MKSVTILTCALLLLAAACGSDVTGPEGPQPVDGMFVVETISGDPTDFEITMIVDDEVECQEITTSYIEIPFTGTDSAYVSACSVGEYIQVSIFAGADSTLDWGLSTASVQLMLN